MKGEEAAKTLATATEGAQHEKAVRAASTATGAKRSMQVNCPCV